MGKLRLAFGVILLVGCAAESDPPPQAGCGDNLCSGEESCASCPSDCGTCPQQTCGNTICDDAETCTSCPADCGSCPPTCGDAQCNGAETCATCATDCGACPPSCGDAQCNGTETCTTCPGDCGSCPPTCGDAACTGSETCTSCSQDCGPCCTESDWTTCSGETICINGECQAAFGRVYRISDLQVTFPELDANGETWDGFGGAPDPIATIFLNQVPVLQTAEVDDRFFATFIESAEVTIPAGSHFEVDVYDSDSVSNDFAFGVYWDPLDADHLHVGLLTWNSGGASISLWITPR